MRDKSIQHRHDQGQGYTGNIRVCVENCVASGLGMERMDELVGVEIEVAVRRGLISRELGQEFWSAWCGSGQERMGFEGSADDDDAVLANL